MESSDRKDRTSGRGHRYVLSAATFGNLSSDDRVRQAVDAFRRENRFCVRDDVGPRRSQRTSLALQEWEEATEKKLNAKAVRKEGENRQALPRQGQRRSDLGAPPVPAARGSPETPPPSGRQTRARASRTSRTLSYGESTLAPQQRRRAEGRRREASLDSPTRQPIPRRSGNAAASERRENKLSRR